MEIVVMISLVVCLCQTCIVILLLLPVMAVASTATCAVPAGPEHAMIDEKKSVFPSAGLDYEEGDIVYFTCKPGFIGTQWMWTKCLDNGNWSLSADELGTCTKTADICQKDETKFLCPGDVCIDRNQLCDCSFNCPDGSDESPDVCMGQSPKSFIDTKELGQTMGVLRSPQVEKFATGVFLCSFVIIGLEKQRIRISIEEMNLAGPIKLTQSTVCPEYIRIDEISSQNFNEKEKCGFSTRFEHLSSSHIVTIKVLLNNSYPPQDAASAKRYEIQWEQVRVSQPPPTVDPTATKPTDQEKDPTDASTTSNQDKLVPLVAGILAPVVIIVGVIVFCRRRHRPAMKRRPDAVAASRPGFPRAANFPINKRSRNSTPAQADQLLVHQGPTPASVITPRMLDPLASRQVMSPMHAGQNFDRPGTLTRANHVVS